MKAKTKTLFVIGLVTALCVGFLIGISVDYPKTSKAELAGTFGKVEKYRKTQMTERDIQLRSELVKDTAKLKTIIQELTYFSVFTENVSAKIDLSLMKFKAQGMGTQSAEADKLRALQDYSDFIKNNNKSLNTTIAMLIGFYQNSTVDESVDVEKSLVDFGAYINSLNTKNTILTEALRGMDDFMVSNLTLRSHKAELAQLKSIRDQLVICGVQLCGMLLNKDQVNAICSYIVASQEKLNAVLAEGQLNVILADGQLSAAGSQQAQAISKDNLKAMEACQQIGASFTGSFVAGTGLLLVYNKESLQFQEESTGISAISSNPGLQVIVIAAAGRLDIVVESFDELQLVCSNLVSSAYIPSSAFLALFSRNDLQSFMSGNNGLNTSFALFKDSNLNLLAL